MSEKGLAIVKTETDETNDQYQRKPDGKFAEGNKGGPGGSRPGSGRRPKPADDTLLKRLYDLLDENADKALEVLIKQLEHDDPKVAQKAALAVLNKVLPEDRLLKGWREDKKVTPEQHAQFREFMSWKMDQDVREIEEAAEAEKKEKEE